MLLSSKAEKERKGEKMMNVRKVISLLLALPLVFIVGYAGATTNSELEKSYHGALGHLSTADVTDATDTTGTPPMRDQGMLEKW